MYIKKYDNYKMPEIIITDEQAQSKINNGEDLNSYIQMTSDEYKAYMANIKEYQAIYEGSDEYKAKIEAEENKVKKEDLQAQIDEIDKKRIRALCEGGNYSDSQTYLEYYTAQIVALRTEIASLDT